VSPPQCWLALNKAGIHASTGVKVGLILVAAVAMVIVPLYGHATIVWVQRWVAQIAIPLLSIMAIMILTKVHLGAVSTGGSLSAFTVSIALIMSGGGLSANCGSDYSRYLPADSSRRAVFWYSSLGGMIPSLLLSLLGAALASVTANGSDPIAGIPQALPSFVLVPYLLFVVLSTLTGVSWDLYSSGLSLQALGVHLRRWQCVAIDALICSALTFVVVFSSQFSHYYSDFLSLLGVWLGPWAAIYLIDWLLRRGTYDAPSLLAGKQGIYWRRNGWHFPAVAAQVLGMVGAALWINSPAFVGPLSSRTGHSDLSIFMGIFISGLVYWILARSAVPAEAHPPAATDLDTQQAVLLTPQPN
jgi:nucleobase:cation symporter-1, NCS1 family